MCVIMMSVIFQFPSIERVHKERIINSHIIIIIRNSIVTVYLHTKHETK